MTEDKALELDEESLPPTDEPVDITAEKEVKEKMLPVSRVEELVKKAKLKGRDAMQAELDALKQENETLKNGGSMGGMTTPSVDADAIAKKVMDDLKAQFQLHSEQRAQQELEEQAKKIAETYHGKMATGKDSFEDFDSVMSDFNPAAFPNLTYLATQVDNTPAVMYELMKNPSKWATLAVLSERDSAAAQNMISKISSSIKANEAAKAEEIDTPAPLNRLSSSTTGQDNGQKSVRDFKAMFRG